MFCRYHLPFLLLFAVVACEPASNDEVLLDQNAVFDQKPVRQEGWSVSGGSTAKFDGLSLATSPCSQSNQLNQQVVNLGKVVINKNFSALDTYKTGTARLNFNISKKALNGIKFDVSFASGVGLPTELRITEAGITAKCGLLSSDDSIPTESYAAQIKEMTDHELRIVRNDSSVTILFDNKVAFANLACNASQTDNRTTGWFKITLYSQQPSSRVSMTSSLFNQYMTELLLKRVTIYKDAVMPITANSK